MFPIETTFVAHDNNEVLTVKLRHETSLVAYSTDKRSTRLSRRTHSFRFFHCFTKHSFRQIWPCAVFKVYILGVFVVWKKLVLVKRRAVDQRVCLSTIAQAEPAELTIQVNAASISFQSVLLTIQTSFSLVSESIMRFIILDNNGILFKQEKSEILENIIKVGC